MFSRGFSTVYLVEDPDNHKLYAVKKIICHSMEDQTVALNEVKIHERIKHENVINLIDYEIDGIPNPVVNSTSQVYLVLPYFKVSRLVFCIYLTFHMVRLFLTYFLKRS